MTIAEAIVMGFFALIGFMAALSLGAWLIAAYKWMTYKRWHGKTPKGNRRI